ncbi:MAG: SDR family oxidoreductase [Dehalococcoidia bacterium]|nr:SDR family oxidoreductase [Dehalococcoidia bacterium]
MIKLKGKGALIVGAKRIGQDVAVRLSKEGVNIAIAYRTSREEAEALCSKVSANVERACVVQGDVSVEEDVKRMIRESSRNLGGISFLVNLASQFSWTPFRSLNESAWDSAMAEAKGSYLLAVHAARAMMKNPGPTRGHIILFGDSAAGEHPYRNYLPYLTAKAATEFMTRAFAAELARHNILVNAICPGPAMKPSNIGNDVWARRIIAKTPLKQESSTEDIAEMVVALLKAETITGECIRVDSGAHLVAG